MNAPTEIHTCVICREPATSSRWLQLGSPGRSLAQSLVPVCELHADPMVQAPPCRTYRIELGNTTERRGHRRDCAQVALTIEVDAPNEASALRALQKWADTYRPRMFTARIRLVSVKLRAPSRATEVSS